MHQSCFHIFRFVSRILLRAQPLQLMWNLSIDACMLQMEYCCFLDGRYLCKVDEMWHVFRYDQSRQCLCGSSPIWWRRNSEIYGEDKNRYIFIKKILVGTCLLLAKRATIPWTRRSQEALLWRLYTEISWHVPSQERNSSLLWIWFLGAIDCCRDEGSRRVHGLLNATEMLNGSYMITE